MGGIFIGSDRPIAAGGKLRSSFGIRFLDLVEDDRAARRALVKARLLSAL